VATGDAPFVIVPKLPRSLPIFSSSSFPRSISPAVSAASSDEKLFRVAYRKRSRALPNRS
jgi:hypothetical protein